MCTVHNLFIDPVLSYCTWKPDLVQRIKEEFAKEYEVIKHLPGHHWVIAGGFVSYLLKLTNTFQDIDIFYVNKEFSQKYEKSEWRRINPLPANYNNISGDDFYVFNHRKYNIQVIEFVKISSSLMRERVFKVLCDFDCVLVRKAIHLKSALFIDCNFGSIKFESSARQKKYNRRVNQSIITQPKTLCLLAYECLYKMQ